QLRAVATGRDRQPPGRFRQHDHRGPGGASRSRASQAGGAGPGPHPVHQLRGAVPHAAVVRRATAGPGARASVQQVSAVLGELATGFACQLREQSLQEQEALKQAVLRARDEAEQALRASEARSRAVFNSSPLGIAIVNLDGVIEETNLAMREIFNCPESKLIGASIYDLVDEQWRDQLRRSEADLLAGRVPRFHVQTCSTAPDGGQVWTQLSASLVCASDGAPEYQVLLYEDITQRHMLQEQFRRQATRDPLTGLA